MSDPLAGPVTVFGPDFPYAYDDLLAHSAGLGAIPAARHGAKVAIIGAGIAGVICGYELMRMGVKPILFESGQFGGRLRSQPFEGADGIIAELGGMRFPVSSTGFYHYVDKPGLESQPFPNPLTPAAGSTVIDLAGETHYAATLADLPEMFREVTAAYSEALDERARFSDLKAAIRARDTTRIKEIWNPIVRAWDERTFYDFVASSSAFQKLSFRHREVFGQVGFGTGGWDSYFPNSMLEIPRVNATECDENQRFILGGVEQVPQGLWRRVPERMVHWPEGTTLSALNGGATRPGAARLFCDAAGRLNVTDRWGRSEAFDAVIATCQSWLLTTAIDTEERLFSQDMWMALDRTRYMQSSETFVMVDRPFWKDKDPRTGRDVMSMTLTDRLTRGTYLFDLGPGRPGVICLTYSWMSDALKMLPQPLERRVELALGSLAKIYPDVDIASHIVGDPITVSWENDPNFLGAFKGALPGHYRYNHRMFGHFIQGKLRPKQRGLFLAGDDVCWDTGLGRGRGSDGAERSWGVTTHLGGHSHPENPGPGDRYGALGPIALPE
jgi:monoamine oxidase